MIDLICACMSQYVIDVVNDDVLKYDVNNVCCRMKYEFCWNVYE